MATPFDLDDVPASPPPRRPVPRGVSLLGMTAAVFVGVLLAQVAYTLFAIFAARWVLLRAVNGQ